MQRIYQFLSEINSIEKISFEKKLRIPVLNKNKLVNLQSHNFPIKILGKVFSILQYKHLKVRERMNLLKTYIRYQNETQRSQGIG